MAQSTARPTSSSERRPNDPAELLQAAYVSTATVPWTQAELLTALAQFRARNLERGITGMLLHCNGTFMQVLEGPAEVVDELLARIARDPRHHGYMQLLRRPIRSREFDGWSMGFRNLSSEDLSGVPGWSDFLGPQRGALETADAPGRAHRLLQSFRGNVLR
jgi:hypothetical protein